MYGGLEYDKTFNKNRLIFNQYKSVKTEAVLDKRNFETREN